LKKKKQVEWIYFLLSVRVHVFPYFFSVQGRVFGGNKNVIDKEQVLDIFFGGF